MKAEDTEEEFRRIEQACKRENAAAAASDIEGLVYVPKPYDLSGRRYDQEA